MIRSYLKMAVRSLRKYRFVSLINLFGLTVGITCCLLILLYVSDELSFDCYQRNADNVYRVERTFLNADTKAVSLELGAVAPPFAPLLKNDFKDIREITSILPSGGLTFQYKDNIFNEPKAYFADENLHKVFDIAMLRGDVQSALKEPGSLVITEEVARKYFGDEDPLNKMLKVNHRLSAKVTGVFKAFPANTHWHPEVLLSFSTLRDSSIYGEKNLRTNWGNNAFYSYILLPEKYNYKTLEAQFPAFLDRHVPDSKNKASTWTTLSLRKLTDIHLRSHKDSELEENGDIKRVYIFSIIGIFILLIAAINYMNLATARSSLRAKEIGIRKVSGAGKGELIAQFLSESLVLCLLATVVSVGLTILLLPALNTLSGKDLQAGQLLRVNIIVLLLLLPFLIGTLSGLYPALFLSSFRPVKVLKGITKGGNRSVSLRKALVIFQFSVSIVLIVSTVIVFQQLSYIQNKALGIEKDQMIILSENAALNNSFPAFRQSLLADASVKEVARSSRIPSGRLLDSKGSQISNGNALAPSKADIKYVEADENFVPAYAIRMRAGRNFNIPDGGDTTSFLLNESAVRALGIQNNGAAIGRQFRYGDRNGQIAGVIADFNFESLHQRILPLVLLNAPGKNNYNRISVKIKGNPKQAIEHIRETWEKFMPEVPFEYNFLDERYADLYQAERRQQTIFSVFACIAVFISCLGLLGLSAFTITQRVKEIGVRKVLGASVSSIVRLLSTDFLLLVAISAVLAFPITWFAMRGWLSDFAYRISISWWVFVVSAVLALLVAFITISFQAVKAALANPVKSLRSE